MAGNHGAHPRLARGLRLPNCLASDATDNRVFVAGALTRTILVLDGTDGRRLGRIPFEAGVRALCYNPAGNKVYAAAADLGAVAVIDAGTMQLIRTIATGDFPAALAYNPTSNKVYCVNTFSNDATVIDGAGDSVVATVPVGQNPCAACWNPARNVVYIANSNSNDVSVIDAAADSVVATITAGYGPSGFVYNPDLNRLYEADFLSGTVTVIDGLTDIVLATIPGYTVSAADWSLNLGYARSLSNLSLGLGLKYVHQQHESLSTSAVAFDAGAMYKTPLEGLKAGLSVANIGTKAKLYKDEYSLPLQARLGWRYDRGIVGVMQDFVLSGEGLGTRSDSSAGSVMSPPLGIAAGVECRPVEVLAVRVGYRTGSDYDGFSGLRAGLGLSWQGIGVDYAFAPYGKLGSSHRLSISYRAAAVVNEVEEE